MTTVTCASCFKTFETSSTRAAYLVTHPRTHEEFYLPKCLCCSCRRRRSNKAKGIEIMEPEEMTMALRAALDGRPWAYAAFQVATNAMLLAPEVLTLTRKSIIEANPCRVRFTAAHWRHPAKEVGLDCVTLGALRQIAGAREGRIFGFGEKTLWREWRETTIRAKLCEYRFAALRQTGIARRCEAVRSLAELLEVRKAARIAALSGLNPYTRYDADGYFGRVRWAK